MTLSEVAAYLERTAAESLDEYEHLVHDVLAPVLLSTPGLIARAASAAIAAEHGDAIAAALAEHAAEVARIDRAAADDRAGETAGE